jgi:hypothetical protein
MNEKYAQSLRLYTLSISDSVEEAEKLATNYEAFFGSLNKYEQLDQSLIIENDGWEIAYDYSIES